MDPTLTHGLKKSTLRFMKTLGPSLVALAQASWSLLSHTLGGYDCIIKVVQNLLPEDNTLPKTYYKAKKILCPMGIEY